MGRSHTAVDRPPAKRTPGSAREKAASQPVRTMPSMSSALEPPDRISYGLEEALELLATLEDAQEVLAESDHLAVLARVEHQIVDLSRKLGFDQTPGGDHGH